MNTNSYHFSPEAEDMHAAASELADRERMDALEQDAEREPLDDDFDDSALDREPELDDYLDAAYEDRTEMDFEHDCPPEFFGGE